MNKGFIALTLVITVTSLLLAFSFTQSIETAHFFDQTKLKEYRLVNYYNAYSCIDQAILNISHDYFYEVSTSTEISDFNCSIMSVKKDNEFTLIEARGNYKNIYVTRKARVKILDDHVEIISID